VAVADGVPVADFTEPTVLLSPVVTQIKLSIQTGMQYVEGIEIGSTLPIE
jgi:hypothetical protein